MVPRVLCERATSSSRNEAIKDGARRLPIQGRKKELSFCGELLQVGGVAQRLLREAQEQEPFWSTSSAKRLLSLAFIFPRPPWLRSARWLSHLGSWASQKKKKKAVPVNTAYANRLVQASRSGHEVRSTAKEGQRAWSPVNAGLDAAPRFQETKN